MSTDAKIFLSHIKEEGLHYTAENRCLENVDLERMRLEFVAAGTSLLRAVELAAKGGDGQAIDDRRRDVLDE